MPLVSTTIPPFSPYSYSPGRCWPPAPQVFLHYDAHRNYILDEILTSVGQAAAAKKAPSRSSRCVCPTPAASCGRRPDACHSSFPLFLRAGATEAARTLHPLSLLLLQLTQANAASLASLSAAVLDNAPAAARANQLQRVRVAHAPQLAFAPP